MISYRRTKHLAIVPWALLLFACSGDGAGDEPYLEFVGGGFIFNYRLAEADYGFVARMRRPIAPGTIIEASFEDPEGGEPLVVTQVARRGGLQYLFRSPPVRGVEAHRDYRVELRLIDPADGSVVATYTRSYRSDVAQSMLPDSPPVTGPGYQRAPVKEVQTEKHDS
jgi:hypothetical protein